MNVSLSMAGMDAIQRGFAEAPDMARRELLAAMTQGTLLVEREAKDATPVGATGLTRASITSDAYSTPMGVLGVVGSSQASATFVELGTRPHMPPVRALIPWVRAVLGVDEKRAPGVAYVIARKIARKGTRAQAPMETALARSQGQVMAFFEVAAARIAEQLGGAPA